MAHTKALVDASHQPSTFRKSSVLTLFWFSGRPGRLQVLIGEEIIFVCSNRGKPFVLISSLHCFVLSYCYAQHSTPLRGQEYHLDGTVADNKSTTVPQRPATSRRG